MILAVDPGTTESGFVFFDGAQIHDCGTRENFAMARLIEEAATDGETRMFAIEMVASYGMAVGAEVFETVRWIGRFQDRWDGLRDGISSDTQLIYRRDVKLHLCGSPRAKDPNIRQALLDLIGPPGTKKSPGPTYGVKSHAWAALAVAATALNLQPKARAA
jgi:hypothetical protein